MPSSSHYLFTHASIYTTQLTYQNPSVTSPLTTFPNTSCPDFRRHIPANTNATDPSLQRSAVIDLKNITKAVHNNENLLIRELLAEFSTAMSTLTTSMGILSDTVSSKQQKWNKRKRHGHLINDIHIIHQG